MPVSYSFTDASQFVRNTGSITAMVGPAEKGPFGVSTLLEHEADLLRVYGRPLADDYAIHEALYALKMGSRIRFSRSVHMTDQGDWATRTSVPAEVILTGPAQDPVGAAHVFTGGPWFLNDGDVLQFDINGATTDVTFEGVAALHTSANAETYDMSGGDKTLLVKIDRGVVQEIVLVAADFAVPATATAAEVAAAISARINGARATVSGGAVRIISDTKGSASYVQITGGDANTVLGFTTAEQASAGPNSVPNVGYLTLADLAVLLAADLAAAAVTVVYDEGAGEITVTTTATGAAVYLGFGASTAGVPEKFGKEDGAGGRNTGADAGAATDALKITAVEEGAWLNGGVAQVVVNANDPTKYDLVISAPSGQLFEAVQFRQIDLTALPTSTLFTFTKLVGNTLTTQTKTFASGANGVTGMTPATRVGGAVGPVGTGGVGIYGFDVLDFKDLFVNSLGRLGGASLAAENAAQIVVKNWAESVFVEYYIEMPEDITTAAAVYDFVLARGAYSALTRIQSSFVNFRPGLVEFPDARLNDGVTTIWLGPAAALAAVLNYNDSKQDKNRNRPGVHLAPSGRARGVVGQGRATRPIGINLDMSAQQNLAYQNQFKEAGINWFETYRGEVLVKGNRTAIASDSSKLRSLSVRRVTMDVVLNHREIMKDIEDEPNIPDTWRSAVSRTEDLLEREYASKGAFEAGDQDNGYLVIGDQFAKNIGEGVLNTPENVQLGLYKMVIRLRIVGSIEDIGVEVATDGSNTSYVDVA